MSDKERQAANEAMFKEIATTVADKCVNPENKRPYPVSMIEKAMKEIHLAVKPNKSTKVQSLEAIHKLKEHLPLEKAEMRVKITVPIKVKRGGTRSYRFYHPSYFSFL